MRTLLTTVCVWTVACLCVGLNTATAVNITFHGSPFMIWNTQDSKCNNYTSPLDLPDVPARAFRDNKGIVHVFAADTTTRVSYGPNVLNIKRNCTIAFNSSSNPNPAFLESNEFIDGTYAFPNGTVVGLLHTEYPGMTYNNCRAQPPNYPACWTVSIGMAVSHDWGYSWDLVAPAPNHLVAAVPYRYDPTGKHLAFGWGDTSGIVQRDGFFYTMMFNRNPIGLQSNGTCLMRTNNLMDPKSWRGWNGTHFSVPFADPYTLKPGEEAAHVCTVLDTLPSNANVLGLTYSHYLEAFIASMWAPFQDVDGVGNGKVGLEHAPFFYATSDDLITWSAPQLLLNPPAIQPPLQHLQNWAYPAFLDASAPTELGDNNFESIGRNATLTWTTITHDFFTEGRQLMGYNVTFTKA